MKTWPELRTVRRADGWFVVGLPNADAPECGPYGTRAEADADRVGLQRTYRHGDRRGFVTCDPRPTVKR